MATRPAADRLTAHALSPDIGADERRSPQDGARLRAGDRPEVLVVDGHHLVAHVDTPVLAHGAQWADGLHLTAVTGSISTVDGHACTAQSQIAQ